MCELSKNKSDTSFCHFMHKLSYQRASIYSELFEILITCKHLPGPIVSWNLDYLQWAIHKYGNTQCGMPLTDLGTLKDSLFYFI